MARFTITRLVGARAMIKGTDVFDVEGQIIVDTTQWDEVNANTAYDQATEAFESAVEEFFAPLTKAAEAMHQQLERPKDSVGYVVLSEAVEGVAAKPAHIVKLGHDSVVLRLVEAGDFDRLVWVNGELEVLSEPGAGLLAQSDSQPEPGFIG